jgi:hypothetical protein
MAAHSPCLIKLLRQVRRADADNPTTPTSNIFPQGSDQKGHNTDTNC